MNTPHTPWWASEDFWRKTAIWVTAFMFVVLIFLTFDSMSAIIAGSDRVPPYSVINKRIDYKFDENRNFQVPVARMHRYSAKPFPKRKRRRWSPMVRRLSRDGTA